ncbi:hypothetical protein KIV65_gp54 [Mycobacterium phage Anthony]|uniref:Uncharacterized protein n=1 Tax=Mycobacterium phage Anthony TaxID=2599857 RepID=A0A5J6TK70_9CAUD|nr:hypothetical protein KIV65_gp54 [Mycobacterium phage Anthony]QFG10414.1 hypothetical protein PBI_ANTHONY_43 [Mycobacterium phage Anthony]
MNVITVFADSFGLVLEGEVVLDAEEDSLIVYGDGGSYINFTRSRINGYMVRPIKEDALD